MSFIDRLLHAGEGRTLKRLARIADQVNSIEDDYVAMTDEELRGQTADFRERLDNGASLDDLLPEAFATVREATKRVLGKRPFDVQIMGGAALHEGNVAEMKTGEGKTIVALAPSYLNALDGKGVHVVTVNDYLAQSQAEQMGRVHHFLGLKTGVILAPMAPDERRRAYACDITYGTNNEFGFDYLRDNMALTLDDCVQNGHHFAIVDEVDSILIDEARTPLIISGPATENKQWYPEFARLAVRLERDTDYEVDEKKRTVSVLAHGIEVTESDLGIDNLYESANTPLIGYLNNAIKAKELFKRDKDYVVIDGEVLIVDEHTGRVLAGRRYNEGLHQALEAKEKVEIKDEYQTLATITLQNYFRMYDKLSGMTGTAKTEEDEFQKVYGLGVLEIPTNKPMIRKDQSDLIYRSEDAKFTAIVDDVVERHDNGQPVLIGTASVVKSEELSRRLRAAGIPHQVLNAKQHAREAAVVAQAGRKGAVTVATNMAGRGTDIMLGGNPEFLADQLLRERHIDPVENPEAYEAQWADTLSDLEGQVADEHEEVVDAGGLYVLGSERHESRRIDNQLRGRSGRQGDPGESRFYLSLEDDLLRLFKPEAVERVMTSMQLPEDQPIEMKLLSRSIESAQKQLEAQNFETRKNVLKYDDVMNRQRHVIYRDRRKVLEGADVEGMLRSTVDRVVESAVRMHTQGFSDEWDLDALWNDMRQLYPVSLKVADYDGIENVDELVDDFKADAQDAYDAREVKLGEEMMRELERQVWLTVLDRKWRDHLYEMDYLREGIGLRAMAQRDPLVEYKREGADMFDAMRAAFQEEVVGFLFNLDIQVPDASEVGVQRDENGEEVDVRQMLSAGGDSPSGSGAATATATRTAKRAAEPAQAPAVKRAAIKGLERNEPQHMTYSAPTETGDVEELRGDEKTDEDDLFAGIGRNDPCPCGSGKKFKNCHGRNPNIR
ncbi:preprotein translocase subunit SecA [Propionibacterium freudenreichii]|uniref:preprotein translocase subunit SecA n=1 Tax=Propionibacterium freudenreichii TaxID=1744 RepID=UPI000543E993|nr:Preprotein translocase SecA subunit [Propionibacterium freudenreichii]SBM43441.1 Protein translocase subunit SecA [Propionibacterium freudenreichii]